MNKARIKLAEAMGWKYDPTKSAHDLGDGYPTQRTSFHWSHSDYEKKRFAHELPDPFTDTNNDYAVLEWMRREGNKDWWQFAHETSSEQNQYKTGNNARAACKVLGIKTD